jgi:hypothetical protein
MLFPARTAAIMCLTALLVAALYMRASWLIAPEMITAGAACSSYWTLRMLSADVPVSRDTILDTARYLAFTLGAAAFIRGLVVIVCEIAGK